jgi:sulfur relay (sulfurtransferase) complex TusBCD TusD component (DsrE family)
MMWGWVMARSRPRLGLLLSTAPDHPNTETVAGLVKAARARQMETDLYLLDEGVANLNHPEISALAESGVHLYVCAYGAQRRGIPVSDRATFCGLVVLSDLMKGCDRFVAF